jgi:hypothetical protein
VSSDEFEAIPSRCFWEVVDRTSESADSAVSHMNPPAEYHMVLDGQQRVQSLLLAVEGDSWGFKLRDRNWSEEINDQRPRGRQSKHEHWSRATLCFDLEMFLHLYEENELDFLAIDFRKVLVWAVSDPKNGTSQFPKPDNYEDPLPKAYADSLKGRFIRFSRLWKEALPNAGLKEAQFKKIIEPVLEQHGVSSAKKDALLQPLGELMTTLRDVKMADVNYLELQPFNQMAMSQAEYNDAIVTIFTRLNTAGRTLTREEITFAWLKVGWEGKSTGGQTAGSCFTNLRGDLANEGLEIAIDELVGACSFVWSVFNTGKLLNNSDLLNGELIRPMASDLSKRWNILRSGITEAVSCIRQHGYEYGPAKHFFSLYALAIPCAWLCIAKQWKADNKLSELEADSFTKKILASLGFSIDRWILCSQWAGRWSQSSETTVAAYVKDLHEKAEEVAALQNSDAVVKALDQHLKELVDGLSKDAITYVATAFPSVRRDRVSSYRNMLWIWHRLDDARWKLSQVQLRIGKKAAAWDVDHTVAFSLWEDMIKTGLPSVSQDQEDALALVNRLGNCVLLEKNFNISKSKDTAKSFLNKVHEFKTGKITLDEWSAVLRVPEEMLDPLAVSEVHTGDETFSPVDIIAKVIATRDTWMREELADFR